MDRDSETFGSFVASLVASFVEAVVEAPNSY